MSLYPFPPRRDGPPPPVPPKTNYALSPFASSDVAEAAVERRLGEERTLDRRPSYKRTISSSLRKISSLDAIRPAASPRRIHTACSTSPLSCTTTSIFGACGSSPFGFPPSTPSGSSRLSNAKQKAKDVWTRRKNSSGTLEPAKTTIIPPTSRYLDSPTLPEAPVSAKMHGRHTSNASGWRRDCLGAANISTAIPAPPLDRMPVTPWPAPARLKLLNSAPLEKPPAFLEKHSALPRLETAVPPNDPQYLRNRAYSAPTKAPPSSRFIPDAEPTTLWGEQVLRHKRKKSSISTSNHRNRTPIAAQDDLSPYEVAFIQKNAMQRRERLNVLSLNSVEKYSQELFELNERYEYIRESRNSARQSRRTLHSKMITYLKTTPSRMFSQDCILGQEEALADLDIEIEDWDDKLEKINKRRMKIKQRLLEHVAAALSIVNSIPPAPTLTAFVKKDLLDTPPATPEKQKRQRQGPERISVYALLAGVKSEVQRTIICTT